MPHTRRQVALAAILWTAFVIYGSLLPFDYVPQSISSAWERFVHAPLLDVGPASRSDWLANVWLYVPLAFLWLGALDITGSRLRRVAAAGIAVLVFCGLAVVVEFLQVYFPPRTVSLNDIIGEVIGTLVGAIAWLLAGQRIVALFVAFAARGQLAGRALGVMYVLAYVTLALFPLDFFLSPTEFAQKDLATHAGWWLAPQACGLALQCSAQLVAEALFAIPIGIALVVARGGRLALVPLLAASLLFGAGIEVAQLFLLSGVSQGASVLAKAVGVLSGGLLAPHLRYAWSRLRASHVLRPMLIVLGIAHVAAIAVLLGFWRGVAVSWPEALARLGEVRWVPFYHYYYTSETRAMASAVVQAALYLPPGILIALGVRSLGGAAGATIAGIASGLLALAAQVSRLVHPPQRPDPTDVLIAAAAAAAAYCVVRWVLRLGQDAIPEIQAAPGKGKPPPKPQDLQLGRLAFVPALLAVGIILATFPIARIELAFGIVVCWGLMLRWPESWLVILLALLPTLDLAPWSGRYYLDEFDLLMLAVAGAALLLQRREAARWPLWLAVLFGIFAMSGLVAISRSVLPWPSTDLASLAAYQSPLNALRVGRGLIWAFALLWLVGRNARDLEREGARFALGMTLGLLGVGLIVLWERIVFAGPFNFHSEYRVAGSFSAISTAGAQIEAYVAAAMPFAVLIMMQERRKVLRLLGLAALLLGLYATVATASRAAYAGVAAALIPMAFALLWSAEGLRRKLVIFLSVSTVAALLWMVVAGTFVTQRFTEVSRDIEQRQSHWALVLGLMHGDWTTRILGMGMGQYPATFLWEASPDRRPATFAFLHKDGESWLRLGSGRAVYVDQFVPVETGQTYTLRGRVRAQAGAAAFLNVALCDKWILYSVGDCHTTFVETNSAGRWESFVRPLAADDLGRGRRLFDRPVKLGLYNGGSSTIDVTDVVLEDGEGRNILDNGNFLHGGDRWYFSADDHFPWNIFNLGLEVFFEQGWLGLLAFVGLVGAVLSCLGARAVRGSLLAAAFLSAIVGYLVPGIFDSVIDDPRMRMLLMMLLCGSVLLTSAKRGIGEQAPLRTRIRGRVTKSKQKGQSYLPAVPDASARALGSM